MSIHDRSILVTGAGGFIGSHLTELVTKSAGSVRVVVRYNSNNSMGWLDTVDPSIRKSIDVRPGDIRDPGFVNQVIQGVDVVFHLAALISIPYSYVAPANYVQTNVMGTLNILEASRNHGVQRVCVTSTSEVYGTAKYVPIDEEHPFQGQSPYSASKIGGDRLAESYYRSFGLPVTIVRPFNTYGPRQSSRAIVPTIISQLLAGVEEISLGSLDPTRDLNYVADTCAGFLAIAESERTIGKEINIATGVEISMGDLAQRIVDLINPNARVVLDDKRIRPKSSEVFRLLGSNELIRSLTDWEPKTDITSGLQKTIDWFQSLRDLNMYRPGEYLV